MLCHLEIDQMFARKHTALTPGHAAAEGAMDEGAETAEQLRRRVQHEADPGAEDAGAPEMAGKAFRDAYEVPAEYPQVPRVSAEAFRRGPIPAGQAAYSPGYEEPRWSVPVPSGVLAPEMITRGPLTAGQSPPVAPSGPAGR